MREIKFRAWDGNELFDVEVISFQTETAWSGYDFYSGDSDERCEFGNNENGILMQYTGVKDKNGKECYEGDIYMEGYKREDGSHKYGDRNIVKDIRDFHPQDSFEIIGNIYENPDFLSNSSIE
jgi:uncharacterized phage protein (TIGR01671 family)